MKEKAGAMPANPLFYPRAARLEAAQSPVPRIASHLHVAKNKHPPSPHWWGPNYLRPFNVRSGRTVRIMAQYEF